MTKREQYFAVAEGNKPVNMPFIPDITDWYNGNHTPPGQPRVNGPAVYVPDDDPVKLYDGTIPERFKGWSLMDFYRHFDWGFHAHIYDWLDVQYDNGVRYEKKQGDGAYTEFYHTPKGSISRLSKLAADGTWCPIGFWIKEPDELAILSYVLESQYYNQKHDYVNWVLQGVGQQGEADLNIARSPFGKIIHEWLGFENTTFAMMDYPEKIEDLLKLQYTKDREVIHLACESPARLVMISDHADENLISPAWYEEYCIPFYREAIEQLHGANKIVSTHLDGNFKGFFGILDQTGFDVLDGCTPAPMFNYEIEELAAAMPEGMCAFVGVPSSLFCQKSVGMDVICGLVDRILKAFAGRALINVGDILPPDGDIDKVIQFGEYVKSQYV